MLIMIGIVGEEMKLDIPVLYGFVGDELVWTEAENNQVLGTGGR